MPYMSDNFVHGDLQRDFLNLSRSWCLDVDTENFARKMDQEDPLRDFRKRFHYPKKKHACDDSLDRMDENEECIYFSGQSLGLQLKSVERKLHRVLQNWAQKGTGCHFSGMLPAASCDVPLKEKMAYLVGALPGEVAAMNTLTVNIHTMLCTFYQPTSERNKILMLAGGFHSDLYAVQSHITLRGYDPEESLIFLTPREGEDLIHPDDILKTIEIKGKDIAVIFLEGVHYYTGQLFDMKEITEAGHEQGCVVGFDLAHAVGNVQLQLHEWNVDFGMWCTYKYLNSGPGGMGAIFCHQRFTQDSNGLFPAVRGWWGLMEDRKFAFEKEFTPAEGADRFRLSNPSPFLSVMILANLEVFKEAGLERLREKQRLLTGYLEYLLRKHFMSSGRSTLAGPHLRIITPRDPGSRGSQISLLSSIPISAFEELLQAEGIICDIRKPSVIRVTPVPLYNTFQEVYKFVHVLKKLWVKSKIYEDPEK